MIFRAFWISLCLAGAFLGWQFGPDIYRYRAMQQALVELDACHTDTECEQAWERVERLKGVKK